MNLLVQPPTFTTLYSTWTMGQGGGGEHRKTFIPDSATQKNFTQISAISPAELR